MQIINLKPHYFRAFGDSSSINFSDKLTIFFGGNGSGKSSLAEALEWLFFGYTKRRRKGDQYSKREYKGSYVNVACPSGESPYVEATVFFDGSEHILKRLICLDTNGHPIDDSFELYFDGNKIQDFSEKEITLNEAHCPIVVQHGIQDFIHTRPIDRYRSISEALGISDLVGFKDILEKSKNQYRKELPDRIVQSKYTLRKLTSSLRLIGLNEIASRWEKGEIKDPDDELAIQDKARELSDSSATDIRALLDDVKLRQSIEIEKVFNIDPYRVHSNLKPLLANLKEAMSCLTDQVGKLFLIASDLSGITASIYLEKQLLLWEKGIEILKETETVSKEEICSHCPFCGESTISKSKLDSIKNRLAKNRDFTKKKGEFEGAVNSIIDALNHILDLLKQLYFRELDDKNCQRLKSMFSRHENQLKEFVDANHTSILHLDSLKKNVNQLIHTLLRLKEEKVQPDSILQEVEPVKNLIENIQNEATTTWKSLNSYSRKFAAFHPILEQELSDEQSVAVFTDLIKLLTIRPQIDIVLAARQFDDEIVEAQRLSDDYIMSKQTNILDTRETEILDWYQKLSPNENVRFSGLEPGRNTFSLRAEAFGRSMNAAASLSQSQLNCLGLSIYIPSIIANESAFQFIVFDDPVQAMDDDHHEAFLLKVVPNLLDDFDRQVIVLTHLQQTADRLRNLNYHRCPLYYKFDKLQPDGPKINEYIPLKDELKLVRNLADGNHQCRKLAVDRIRVICEMIMRETHIMRLHSEMPEHFRSGKSMLTKFRKLPGVKPKQWQNLDDSIEWSDPSHHTDPDWQAPDSPSINLHIDRLFNIINELELPC